MRVSPAAGMRVVRVIKSVLREPIIVIIGFAMWILKKVDVLTYSETCLPHGLGNSPFTLAPRCTKCPPIFIGSSALSAT